MVDVATDGRMALLHVEPPGVPPLQRCAQRYSEVLAYHPFTELQIYAADHSGTAAAFLLQLEQVLEEVKVGKNSEIRLTKMDEDRYVQYGIWVEVA